MIQIFASREGVERREMVAVPELLAGNLGGYACIQLGLRDVFPFWNNGQKRG